MRNTDRTAIYINKDIELFIRRLLPRVLIGLIILTTFTFAIRNPKEASDLVANTKNKVNSLSTSNISKCNTSKNEVNNGLLPTKIIIKKIQMEIDIRSVHFKNGTWEVYPDTANYAIGTSMINMKEGNTGIYGTESFEAFRNIKQLNKKDEFQVIAISNTSSKEFIITYEVATSGKVTSEVSDLFYPTKESQITIILTGESFKDTKYFIIAKPFIIEIADCNLDN